MAQDYSGTGIKSAAVNSVGNAKGFNIYTTTTTTTEVLLIDSDVVQDPQFGYANNVLQINNLHIANIGTEVAIISLYLKRTVEGTFDSVINSPTDSIADVSTIFYFLKSTSIPVGAALGLEGEIFKDIDFRYYGLYVVGINSDTNADIIINFKK
jgi:hypothetical protein|tara:strand:- start:1375 stop:1836 length:462 start_codon:yes stop_codon:yes gene_type:complete